MRLHIYLMMTIGSISACSGSSFKGGSGSSEVPLGSISSDEANVPFTNSGDGVPGVASPLPPKDQVTALKEKCAKAAAGSMQTLSESISYPEHKSCAFDSLPNLARQDKFVQASFTSPGTLKLPDGEICSISIQSPANAKLHYDDFLILTIDSRVIFLSNALLDSYLGAADQGIYTWDFAKVVGKKIQNFEAAPFCLSKGANCVLPGHDKEGPVHLNLQPDDIAPIAASIAGKASVPMELTATGDNDDTDCWHTALDVTVQIKYLPKQ